MSVMSLLSLQPLKGDRSQITIIVAFIVNVLVWTGILKVTPEEQLKLNEAIGIIFAYFFTDKVSRAITPK